MEINFQIRVILLYYTYLLLVVLRRTVFNIQSFNLICFFILIVMESVNRVLKRVLSSKWVDPSFYSFIAEIFFAMFDELSIIKKGK